MIIDIYLEVKKLKTLAEQTAKYICNDSQPNNKRWYSLGEMPPPPRFPKLD
jgi:hypothetical protein